jgi:hypothetical protein
MTSPVKYPVKHPVSNSPVPTRQVPRLCQKPLKTNPFECHRDPITGRWVTLLNSERSARTEAPLAQPVEIAVPQPLLKRLYRLSQTALAELRIGRQLSSLTTAAATAVTAVTALWVIAR